MHPLHLSLFTPAFAWVGSPLGISHDDAFLPLHASNSLPAGQLLYPKFMLGVAFYVPRQHCELNGPGFLETLLRSQMLGQKSGYKFRDA
jgi:hypothetical protein